MGFTFVSFGFYCVFSIGAADAQTQSQEVECSDTQAALAYWRPIKAAAASNDNPVDQFALSLVDCLGSENSELRDGIGYELFTYWLRNEKLSEQSKRELLISLSENLTQASKNYSLSRSFSALVLSELVRADNLAPFMANEERGKLLQTTIDALVSESDYRGLIDGLGWVHPVAHLSDILWRFSLHESISQAQADLILAAIRTKAGVSASGYITNEGDRLARPAAVLIARSALPTEQIIAWLGSFETNQAGKPWLDSFASSKGMNELHNTKLFIRALKDQLETQELDKRIRTKLGELTAIFASTI